MNSLNGIAAKTHTCHFYELRFEIGGITIGDVERCYNLRLLGLAAYVLNTWLVKTLYANVRLLLTFRG